MCRYGNCTCYKCIKDVRPSDKFDNPYLIIPWVTNDNSEHLCEPVSGTCFRVLCTLLYLHEHCPYTVDSRYYVDGLLRYIGYYVGNSKHKTVSYINLYKMFPNCL